MEVADPNGDVILVVGTEDPKSILVSSKILTLASPVFATMLGPNFLEGHELSNRGTRPYELRLPEDDVEAIIYICLLLHFHRNVDDFANHLTISLFEKIALLCNKYKHAGALKNWSRAELCAFNSVPKDHSHYERKLYISYVFEIHEAFWASSKAFLLNGSHRGATNRPSSLAVGLTLLPDNLLDHINRNRKVVIHKLYQTIERIISPHLSYESSVIHTDLRRYSKQLSSQSVATANSFAPCAYGSDVCLRSKRILHYFREFMRLGLWPVLESIPDSTIGSILVRFTQYENLPGDFNTSGEKSPCRCTYNDFQKKLRTEANGKEEALKGLCLKCVQNGRFSPYEGNCQAKHRSLCSPSGQSKDSFGDPVLSTIPAASTTQPP